MTFKSVTTEALRRFREVLEWLDDFGLSADMNKTEMMFFHRPRLSVSKYGTKPPTLHFLSPTPLTFTPASKIRYLGVFFTPNLDWTPHVRTMAARARSTIRALQVLGNSIRGVTAYALRYQDCSSHYADWCFRDEKALLVPLVR